ncbi:MAG: hypothetical protein KatS3mg132_195 [Limisphaera sp.]|nr:MAG: hypothetical protein KatS3mg132_195 [Limisphaera sp.]
MVSALFPACGRASSFGRQAVVAVGSLRTVGVWIHGIRSDFPVVQIPGSARSRAGTRSGTACCRSAVDPAGYGYRSRPTYRGVTVRLGLMGRWRQPEMEHCSSSRRIPGGARPPVRPRPGPDLDSPSRGRWGKSATCGGRGFSTCQARGTLPTMKRHSGASGALPWSRDPRGRTGRAGGAQPTGRVSSRGRALFDLCPGSKV